MDSLGGHHTAAAHAKVELEAELGERNGAPAINPLVEQEARGPMPMADDRRTRPERVRRLIRRLRPAPIGSAFKRWLKHPAHLAQFAWAVCVALSFALLGLLLLGVFDGAFRRRSVRDRWVEIVNQILNALFTLMTIYQHPELFHHAALLLRWRPGDEKELRKAYCRKGSGGGEAQRERERLHLSVVVGLLHLTCFAQYAWMFCWGCALAQEVRTGNLLLDVESTGGSGGVQVQVDNSLRPLPREDGSFEIAAVAGTPSVPLAYNSPRRGEELPLVQLKRDGSWSPGEMRPPVPPLMQDGGGPQGGRIQ
ncbi:unnamed protein product [Triticum turgidum subsp. durum]|uniref:Uncharacterized protein n=1 Tax=Triticum turgidum subsp. durum TaxID=4567 RepID=A0A9R1B8P4_TRITD|nr:unnamed protein product [Triticum turgidum subsp. durum]